MVLAATDTIPAAPVLTLMAIGVIVAIVGHATKIRTLVVTGIMILFVATVGVFVFGYAAFEGDSDHDPRPPCGETVKTCDKDDPPDR